MTAPGAVLVHGLWHGAWAWDDVRAALAALGVDSVAVDLPLTDLPADVRAARDALDALRARRVTGKAVLTRS
jgi:pimeloyl-ACP methyl ester carboxylesterase